DDPGGAGVRWQVRRVAVRVSRGQQGVRGKNAGAVGWGQWRGRIGSIERPEAELLIHAAQALAGESLQRGPAVGWKVLRVQQRVVQQPKLPPVLVPERLVERVLDPMWSAQRIGLWIDLFIPENGLRRIVEFAVQIPGHHGPPAVGAAPQK